MTDDEIDTIWWMAGHMTPGDFRKYMRVVFASIAATAGAKLSASNLPEEFRIKDPADYKRTMDTQFAAPPASSVADAAGASETPEFKAVYQEGHFHGYHDGMKAAGGAAGASEGQAQPVAEVGPRIYDGMANPIRWVDMEAMNRLPIGTKLYTHPSAEIAALRERIAKQDVDIAENDALIDSLRERIAGMEKDVARYRWLRQQRFEFNHSRVTPVRPDKLDTMIDAAIAREYEQ